MFNIKRYIFGIMLMTIYIGNCYSQTWISINNEKTAYTVLEFMKDHIKNNWDSIQTISIEKNDNEDYVLYRGEIRIGYKMNKKCTKYNSNCDTDGVNYICNTIEVKDTFGKLEVTSWNKKSCN